MKKDRNIIKPPQRYVFNQKRVGCQTRADGNQTRAKIVLKPGQSKMFNLGSDTHQTWTLVDFGPEAGRISN